MTDQVYSGLSAFNAREIDVKGKGLGRLAIFEDQTRFVGWLTSYLNALQDLEDIAWDVFVGRTLAQAVGVQLDNLGSVLGEPRRGKSDDDYRIFLSAKIRVNKSDGTIDWLIDTAELFSADDGVELRDLYPAAFLITLIDGLTVSTAGAIVATFLSKAAAAGVTFHLGVYAGILNEWLRARSINDPETAIGRGGWTSSDYYAQSADMLEGSSSMTVSALIRYDSDTGGEQYVISNFKAGEGGWIFWVDSGFWNFSVSTGGPFTTITSAVAMTPGDVYSATASLRSGFLNLAVGDTTETPVAASITPATTSTARMGDAPDLAGAPGGVTIIGISFSQGVGLENVECAAANRANVRSFDIVAFDGAENLYSTTGGVGVGASLEQDQIGSDDWTQNGTPTTVTVARTPTYDARGVVGLRTFDPWADFNAVGRTTGVTGVGGWESAETLEDDNGASTEGINRTYHERLPDTQYCFSFYLKKDAGATTYQAYIQIVDKDVGGASAGSTREGSIDLTDGTYTAAGSSGPMTVTVTDTGTWLLFEGVWTTESDVVETEVRIFPAGSSTPGTLAIAPTGTATVDFPQINPGSSRVENFGGKLASVYDTRDGLTQTSGVSPTGFSEAYSDGFGA